MSRQRLLDGDLDPILGAWLEDMAGAARPAYLDQVLARTRRTRQRPAWTFPGRWLPVVTWQAPTTVPRLAWQLLLLGLLLLALLAAIAIVGGRRTPPPFGLARPGLIAIDIGHHIAVSADDGVSFRLLTTGAAADTCPTWSPDGLRLAFWRATGSGYWTIVVMDADGRTEATIGIEATTPLPYPSGDARWSTLDFALGAPSVLAWSPDSRRIAFSQPTGGASGVWVVGADGSGLTRLTDPALQAHDPAWSSDGRRIAFHGGSLLNDDAGIWVMAADGTDPRRVSSVEGVGDSFDYPQWQPGGWLIAFVALPAGKAHVYVVGADGTGERDLTAPSADSTIDDWLPSWSPDGARLAYLRFTGAVPTGRLVIVSPNGTGAVVPPGQPDRLLGLPMWSPDGKAVTVLVGDATTGIADQMLTLDLTGTKAPTSVPISANAGGTSWQRLAP